MMSSSDGFSSDPPDLALVTCPVCIDDRGEPTGDMLVQLPSGTWVRQVCESCRGLKKIDREGMARQRGAIDHGSEPVSEPEDAGESKRPTTAPPPFDPAEFARESEAKVRAAIEAPASGLRTMARPDNTAAVLNSLNEALDVRYSIPDVQEVETLSGAQDALGTDAVPVLSVSRESLARSTSGWRR